MCSGTPVMCVHTCVGAFVHADSVHPDAVDPFLQAEGEAEEEEVVELTEEEEAIKASLEATESLAPEILDNIVPQWWNKEPFK